MIFDPKKEEVVFEPPPPPPLSKPQKSGFEVGDPGGSGPKTHRGMCLWDKIMILQRVELTIQPLGVGYANRPKKAQNGGGKCVVCSPFYACLALT